MYGSLPMIQSPRRPATIALLLLLAALFLVPSAALSAVVDVPLVGDIDGDSKSDLIVWHAGTSGEFRWVLSSGAYSDVAAGSKQWGTVVGGVPDVPLIADIDGDGKSDLIVYRPGTATFYWLTSSSGYSSNAAGSKQWGDYQQPDVPLAGDIDGDGKADLAVWRRGNAIFYWLTSSTGYSYSTGQGQKQWGTVVNGVPDVPLLRDADGDGKADLFVWRPGTATFYWLTSSSGYSTNAARSRQWGDFQQPDVPLLNDIDGDRKADLFVWRQGNGIFYWLTSSTKYSYALGQGQKQLGGIVNRIPDVPLLGDIDGDSKADLHRCPAGHRRVSLAHFLERVQFWGRWRLLPGWHDDRHRSAAPGGRALRWFLLQLQWCHCPTHHYEFTGGCECPTGRHDVLPTGGHLSVGWSRQCEEP